MWMLYVTIFTNIIHDIWFNTPIDKTTNKISYEFSFALLVRGFARVCDDCRGRAMALLKDQSMYLHAKFYCNRWFVLTVKV